MKLDTGIPYGDLINVQFSNLVIFHFMEFLTNPYNLHVIVKS